MKLFGRVPSLCQPWCLDLETPSTRIRSLKSLTALGLCKIINVFSCLVFYF
jgi:hypothetical protein